MFNVTASGDFSGIMGAARKSALICDMEPIIQDIFNELSNNYGVVLFQIKVFDADDGGRYILATMGDDSLKNTLENPDNWNSDGDFHNLSSPSAATIVNNFGDRLRAVFYDFCPLAYPAWWMMWQWVTSSYSEVDMIGKNMQDPVGRNPE